MVMLRGLRDLPFGRNQPLKSACKEYIWIFKNKMKTSGILDELKNKTRRLDIII
jgi:hypothetical protein